MKKFICQECENPIKIEKGDFIFSFNINCDNEHKFENINLDELLSMRKNYNNINQFQCKQHKKKKIIHCFNCNEDLCFLCFKQLHKMHKIEYINKLDFSPEEKYNIKNYLNKEKKTIDSFLNELIQFQSKLNIYINILSKEIKKYHQLRNELYDDISQDNISYKDIDNNQKVFNKNNMLKIIDYANNFINCETFLKKYDYFKDMIGLLVKKGQFIEEQNIKNKYNIYKRMKIIPIDNKYFFNLYNKYFEIAKNISTFYSKEFEYKTIFKMNHDYEDYNIVLKQRNNIEEELSFYILHFWKSHYHYDFYDKTDLFEMTVKDLNKYQDNKNNNYNIKKVKTFNSKIDLLILSENKYIVTNCINVILYDNLFKKEQIINLAINSFMKINQNVFTCLNTNNNILYTIKIEENFIDKITIKNCGNILFHFSKKKKILFSLDNYFFYLINFNTVSPEVIQKIEFNFNNKNIINKYNSINKNVINLLQFLNCFNDDSIFLKCKEIVFKNYSNYSITYLTQLKIIDYTLVELSRIVVKSKKLEELEKRL